MGCRGRPTLSRAAQHASMDRAVIYRNSFYLVMYLLEVHFMARAEAQKRKGEL